MSDVFVEQLVKQKTLPKIMLLKIVIWVLAVNFFVLFTMSTMYLGQLGGILAVLSLVGAWYGTRLLNLEYEYIYLNGEIDFDKIMGQQKRKRVFTIRVSSFNEFGEYTQSLDQSKYQLKYNFAENLGEGDYYITFNNKDGKSCVLFFSPNEKLATELTKQHKHHTKFGKR